MPGATSANRLKFLRGDGSWIEVKSNGFTENPTTYIGATATDIKYYSITASWGCGNSFIIGARGNEAIYVAIGTSS